MNFTFGGNYKLAENSKNMYNYNIKTDKLVRDAWYTDEEWEEHFKIVEPEIRKKEEENRQREIKRKEEAKQKEDKRKEEAKKEEDRKKEEYNKRDYNKKNFESKRYDKSDNRNKYEKKSSSKEQNEKRGLVFDSLKNQKTTFSNTRSRMCRNKSNCFYKNCNFAHSLDELTPVSCSFDEVCRYKSSTCQYFHSSETKTSYAKRLKI